jgi:uncharacterized protein (DUF486 family)
MGWGGEGGRRCKGGGGGRGEMTQALYAHMNNKEKRVCKVSLLCSWGSAFGHESAESVPAQ